MTKEAVLKNFFEGFGMPAYPDTAVPDDCEFPWITYEVVTDNWQGGDTAMTVNIWDYTSDEAWLNAKARELGEAIDKGDPLPCDGGCMWLKRGRPWCTNMTDDNDSNIKHRYINISVEYMTED